MSFEQEKFGVEVELIAPFSAYMLEEKLQEKGIKTHYTGYTHRIENYWKIVTDQSISIRNSNLDDPCPYEMVSPILKGEEGMIEVFKTLNVLREIGCVVNTSCGFHVHVDTQTDEIAFFKNLYKIYHDYEKDVIDKIMPHSRRANKNRYCRSVKEHFELIKSSNSSNYLASRYNRFNKLNYASFNSYKTVEFRQHSGTLNGDKALNWIRICLSMVQKARKGFNIPMPANTNLARADKNSIFATKTRYKHNTQNNYIRKVLCILLFGHANFQNINPADTDISNLGWYTKKNISDILTATDWGTIPSILKKLNLKYFMKIERNKKYYKVDLTEFGYPPEAQYHFDTPLISPQEKDKFLSFINLIDGTANDYAYLVNRSKNFKEEEEQAETAVNATFETQGYEVVAENTTLTTRNIRELVEAVRVTNEDDSNLPSVLDTVRVDIETTDAHFGVDTEELLTQQLTEELTRSIDQEIVRGIVYDVCGVQPMTGPSDLNYTMRSRYGAPAPVNAVYNPSTDTWYNSNDLGERTDQVTALEESLINRPMYELQAMEENAAGTLPDTGNLYHIDRTIENLNIADSDQTSTVETPTPTSAEILQAVRDWTDRLVRNPSNRDIACYYAPYVPLTMTRINTDEDAA